jgi:hypothetical protein
MSDTCIVCLGDLGEGAPEPAVAAAIESLPRPEGSDGNSTTTHTDLSSRSLLETSDDESEKIAHLLPCGHYLHNECLKPWVERANSCPICRQKFNVVELSDTLGGILIYWV